MDKPYLITGRVRNNRLWSAVREKYPKATTQKEMAAALGIKPSAFNALLNMRRYPLNHGKPSPNATHVAHKLGKPFEFLFSDHFYNFADAPAFSIVAGSTEWATLAAFNGWPLKEFAQTLKKVVGGKKR